MALLRVSGIYKYKGEEVILDNIHLKQDRFEKVAIAGETGSGKSTLLKIIAGFIQPDAGEVLFDKRRVIGPDEQLLPGHPAIAYLSQHFELRNNYRVEEVLDMANKMTNEEAAEVYDVCQVNHLLKRRTDQLSGGEKQRIATARLLITRPKLLLMDEPFSNLDMLHKKTMKAVIDDIGERLQITCILISHDPLDTLSWAQKVIVMKDGKIIQQASPKDIYSKPETAYTAALFGNYNLLTAEESRQLGVVNNLQKRLLVRPEQLQLNKPNAASIQGEINKVNYFGSYNELEVIINYRPVVIKTNDNSYSLSDAVSVSFTGNDAWFM